jgi:hypothetical protein
LARNGPGGGGYGRVMRRLQESIYS